MLYAICGVEASTDIVNRLVSPIASAFIFSSSLERPRSCWIRFRRASLLKIYGKVKESCFERLTVYVALLLALASHTLTVNVADALYFGLYDIFPQRKNASTKTSASTIGRTYIRLSIFIKSGRNLARSISLV